MSDLYSVKRFVENYRLMKKISATLRTILWSFVKKLKRPLTYNQRTCRTIRGSCHCPCLCRCRPLSTSASQSRVVNVDTDTRLHISIRTRTHPASVIYKQLRIPSFTLIAREFSFQYLFAAKGGSSDFYQMAVLSSKEWTSLSHTTRSLTTSTDSLTADKIRVSCIDTFAY